MKHAHTLNALAALVASGALAALLASGALAVAQDPPPTGRAEAQTETPPVRLELPLQLGDLIPHRRPDARTRLWIQVLDASGAAVPNALLWLEPEEGGRVAFQCDALGRIALWIGSDLGELDNAAVSVRTLPSGHSFVGVPLVESVHNPQGCALLILEVGHLLTPAERRGHG